MAFPRTQVLPRRGPSTSPGSSDSNPTGPRQSRHELRARFMGIQWGRGKSGRGLPHSRTLRDASGRVHPPGRGLRQSPGALADAGGDQISLFTARPLHNATRQRQPLEILGCPLPLGLKPVRNVKSYGRAGPRPTGGPTANESRTFQSPQARARKITLCNP